MARLKIADSHRNIENRLGGDAWYGGAADVLNVQCVAGKRLGNP
jgi:hypothetical protein